MTKSWWKTGLRALFGAFVLAVVYSDVLPWILQRFNITTTEALGALLVLGSIITLDSIEVANIRHAETMKAGFYLGVWFVLLNLPDVGSPIKILGASIFLAGILYITGIIFRNMLYPMFNKFLER